MFFSTMKDYIHFNIEKEYLGVCNYFIIYNFRAVLHIITS